MVLMCRLATSASIRSTETSRSAAMLSARLMLVKVLPSPGSALVTMMIRDSLRVAASRMAFSMSGRLMRRY